MKKIIDIKEELIIPLKVLAVKQNKPLKNYIEDVFVAIEKLSKRVDGIDEFLTKATKDFKEDGKEG